MGLRKKGLVLVRHKTKNAECECESIVIGIVGVLVGDKIVQKFVQLQ